MDGTAAYRLTHDTLAPLLRERFRVSPDLAQRARHLLEGRAATWKGQPTDPVLDRVDLVSVEEGLPWMRALEKDEPALLEASRRAEERRAAEEEEGQRQLRDSRERADQARRDKEQETALRLKDQEEANRRQQEDNRRLRKRAFWLLGTLAATVAFAWLAGLAWYKANEQTKIAQAKTRIATSRQIAALSTVERDKRLDRSLLLAIEAVEAENTFEARDSLYKAIHDRPRIESFMHHSASWVVDVAFSFDSKTIAAVFKTIPLSNAEVVLWDVAVRERLTENPLRVEGRNVNTVAFSPDRKTLALGYGKDRCDGGVVLWNVATREHPVVGPILPMTKGEVVKVAFSPNGNLLAAKYSLGLNSWGVVLWDVASPERRPKDPFLLPGYPSGGLAFSPDGKILAAGYSCLHTGGDTGGVRLWDIAGPGLMAKDPPPVSELALPEGPVWDVAFSGYGDTLGAAYGNSKGAGVASGT